MDDEQRRSKFRNILEELSKNQDFFQSKDNYDRICDELEELYYLDKENRYRHYYSDIFSVLIILKEEANCGEGDIQILGQNLQVLHSMYKAKNYDENNNLIDISDSIRKLYDHVSLDIARINYLEAEDINVSGESTIIELKSQIKKLKNQLEDTAKLQQETEEKLKYQQRDYIAILGIFASIVLTFMTGIAFSSSVLQNIKDVSSYRLIAVSLLIGLVLINVLFTLFYYIDRLVNKNKETRRIKPMIVTNIILVLMIVTVVAAWLFGFVESRNKRIPPTEQNVTINI